MVFNDQADRTAIDPVTPRSIGGPSTQDTFTGNSGNNSFTGTGGNDTFDLTQGGNDSAHGGAGDDVFNLGNTFAAGNSIHGDSGNDTLLLAGGSYAAGLSISGSMLSGVEQVDLAAGHSYKLTFLSGSAHNVSRMVVSGATIGAANHVILDASALTNNVSLGGSLGSDTLIGGKGDDWLYSSPGDANSGGNDTIKGSDGNDIVLFGADLDASDRIDGGAGIDTLDLSGDYSAGLTFTAAMMKNMEGINVNNGFDYNLTTVDATAAGGTVFAVDASLLDSDHHLNFDGSAETNARFVMHDGFGNDTLSGGAGDDQITLRGGDDIVYGRGGDDRFFYTGGDFSQNDRVDGGAGNDAVYLYAPPTTQFVLTSTIMNSIEEIVIVQSATYHLTTADSLVGAGTLFTLDAGSAGGGTLLTFDGSAETDGHFRLIGGIGTETLIGGSGDDTLQGGTAGDTLQGGPGHDTYVYTSATDSWGGPNADQDTIIGFDAKADSFVFASAVTGVNAEIDAGALTSANFDNDLAAALQGHLTAHHAIVFKPDSGDLAGKTYLIVDQDGTAGYASGADSVIQLQNPQHLASLAASNFS